MNKTKHETPWTLDWQNICIQINHYEGWDSDVFNTQKKVLKQLYVYFNGSLRDMSEHIGVSYQSLTRKLVLEGIHKKKIYDRGRRTIGPLRQMIRDLPENYFDNMTFKDIKKEFPNHDSRHITRLLRLEGRTYLKKWYWAKSNKRKGV